MLAARYLVRFDDLCPTMNWTAWGRIEDLLRTQNVRPLVAVVPDNRDEKLMVDEPRADFWDRVRTWQEWGWTIGMHGHQHRYLTRDRGIHGFNARSEFAGLAKDEQEEKIRAGLEIFEREGVRTTTWVAPNHSFDQTTLGVLHEAGVDVISDGPALYPYMDRQGLMWIPRQLYMFEPRPMGVWTVCLHHNGWKDVDVDRFETLLTKYRRSLTNVPSILRAYRGRRWGVLDSWFAAERAFKMRVSAALSVPAPPKAFRC